MREGILKFRSQKGLKKAMDELEGTEHKASKLRPLYIGSKCLLQNQSGSRPRKWGRIGVVMKVLPFDQFLVRIDGLRRLTRRSRRFIEFVSQEDNVSHKSPDSPSMFSDDSNDARTDEKNEPDKDHKNVEEEHTTVLMVPIIRKYHLLCIGKKTSIPQLQIGDINKARVYSL